MNNHSEEHHDGQSDEKDMHLLKKDAFDNMAVYLNFIKCYYHYNDYSCICDDRNQS